MFTNDFIPIINDDMILKMWTLRFIQKSIIKNLMISHFYFYLFFFSEVSYKNINYFEILLLKIHNKKEYHSLLQKILKKNTKIISISPINNIHWITKISSSILLLREQKQILFYSQKIK